MQRCKTCGREFTAARTMSYSDYGYCSWDCLMKKKSRNNGQNRVNRKNNGFRNDTNPRSKWAQNY